MFEQWVPPCHEQPGPPWAVAVESESAAADGATDDDDCLAAAAIGHDEGLPAKGGSEPPGGGNDGAPLPLPDGVAADDRPRR